MEITFVCVSLAYCLCTLCVCACGRACVRACVCVFVCMLAHRGLSLDLSGGGQWLMVSVYCVCLLYLDYKDMLLEQIALEHCAMQLLKSELEMDNPLLGDDWRSLASVCGFDSAELEIERISDTLGFIGYWRSSRYRPSLEDLLVGLLKVGLVALAEVLGLYFFQLVSFLDMSCITLATYIVCTYTCNIKSCIMTAQSNLE